MSAPIKAGVIGHPIAHSLSPKLHQFWLKRYNIQGEYKAYDVAPETLADFIGSLKEKGFAGCNVTIPHKETIMLLLDEVDELAHEVGAVNTLVVKQNKIHGTNTDVVGFMENVRPHLLKKDRALILGAGGAARGVVVALKKLGFGRITIANRTKDKAEVLAEKHRLHVVGWADAAAELHDIDLLVNATSLGLNNEVAPYINLQHLPREAVVSDIVYKPLITPILTQAKQRGNRVVDGLGMLLHQAVPGFKAWFGVEPRIDDALRQHLLAP